MPKIVLPVGVSAKVKHAVLSCESVLDIISEQLPDINDRQTMHNCAAFALAYKAIEGLEAIGPNVDDGSGKDKNAKECFMEEFSKYFDFRRKKEAN